MTAPPGLAGPSGGTGGRRPPEPPEVTRAHGIPIGHIAGIPIGVQPLWLLIVGLLTWSLGEAYFPQEAEGLSREAAYALGLLSALLLFAGILLHEIGHAIVARRHGVRIEEIDLWLLGGIARMRDEPPDARAELRFALAGPAVTAVIVAVWGVSRVFVGSPDWLRALIDYQLLVNAAILVFNLLPAFPLDGGRVLRAALWARSGDQMGATERAAATGRVFGWGLVLFGLFSLALGVPNGLFMAIIGGFIIMAGKAEADHLRLRRLLAGRTVADAMVVPADVVESDATAEEVVRFGVARHLHRSFPVVDDAGRAVGVLAVKRIRVVPPERRETVTAGELADRDPDLVAPATLPLADLLDRQGFLREGLAAVVDASGRVVGVVSSNDVASVVTAAELLARPGGSTAAPRP